MDIPERVSYRKVIRHNQSLSPAGRFRFLRWGGAGMGLIGMGFFLRGFWPILILEALAIAGLWLAFQEISRRDADWELLEIRGDDVHWEIWSGGARQIRRMNRIWMGVDRGSHGEIFLRHGGVSTEIGAWLSLEGRESLASDLNDLKRMVSR